MKSATNQRKEHLGYNSVAIFIRLAVVASKISEILWNSTKIRTYSISVIQGHWSWCQSKPHM